MLPCVINHLESPRHSACVSERLLTSGESPPQCALQLGIETGATFSPGIPKTSASRTGVTETSCSACRTGVGDDGQNICLF